MKKIFIALAALPLLFTACEKYNDQFDGLDDKIHAPRIETNSVTLQSADYSTISTAALKDAVTPQDSADAKSINTNKYFSATVPAADYIPYFLKKAYNTFDEGSACIVTFNFNAGLPAYLPADTLAFYTLAAADYDAMGTGAGQPGQFDNFSSTALPGAYLPAFLLGKYPLATTGDVKLITYKYYNGTATESADYYKFNGTSWDYLTTGYWLINAEYDAMGTRPNEPGQFRNFSSSVSADVYLPLFLKTRFPVAKKNDVQKIAYKYYTGSVTRAKIDEYTFDGTAWIKTKAVIAKTEQFVFTDSQWKFDPSVTMTMQTSDYKIMVDYVLATPEIAIFAQPEFKNEEFYYGFGNRYSNVSFRLTSRNPYFFGKAYEQPASIDAELYALATTEEKVALLWERLEEGMRIFLELRYPGAVPQVNGVDVFYNVTVKVYTPDGVNSSITNSYKYKFQCTAVGEFTFVEGPTLVQ